jgi:PKD repeat protein
LTINFSAGLIDPINGFIDNYQWDFDGDGLFDYYSESTGNISHVYGKAGSYKATLKVTDGPHTATDSLTITVLPSPPTATAVASPSSGPKPLSVNFAGTGNDPDGTIISYGLPDSWVNYGGLLKGFTQDYGITYKDTDMDSGTIISTLIAEAKSPVADTTDLGLAFAKLVEDKALSKPYKHSYWSELPDYAKDPQGRWSAGFYGVMAFWSMRIKSKMCRKPGKIC